MGNTILLSKSPDGGYAADQDAILYLLADDGCKLEIHRFRAFMIN